MPDHPKNVILTDQIETTLHQYLQAHSYSKVAVLVDKNTHAYCYPLIAPALADHLIIEIKSGESRKNLETCTLIWDQMTLQKMDRRSLLINLGGGVIGDMGGFCAATYKRGIDFVNIPTTLLAQVDASIGGKLGIDFRDFKNHIGVFQEPQRVMISTEFLSTLPANEFKSGFAEVLKHTLISDAEYWHKINQISWEEQDWQAHVLHSIQTKNQIVTEDPKESGLRKVLNFGHTIGHAIERQYLSTDQPLLHGEAIAIGMICEAFLSESKTGLSAEALTQITQHIFKWYPKMPLAEDKLDDIAHDTLQDKKNTNGRIQASLLKAIGQATYDIEITISEVLEALDFYQKQATN